MSDKELIIKSLEKVDRRIRTNRLFREFTVGLSAFLLIPLLFKAWDLFRPFRGRTVVAVFVLWLIGVTAYLIWRMSGRSTLSQAAAALDLKASLKDEIKSAYWFATTPHAAQRSNSWVELQVRRAAARANQLNIDQLYPRVIPRTSYLSLALIALLIVLNFLPFSTNHNWMLLQAAPAFSLTPDERALISETRKLLKQAQQLDQQQLAQQLEQIVQNLEEGKIDAPEALKQLEDLKNLLDEGNFDTANINEGLDEMAQDLATSADAKEVSDAMAKHDLQDAADQLKKLAEDALKQDDAEAQKALQDALQQASENSHPGLQNLADDMKQAADGLAKGDQKTLQDALNQASKDAQSLAQKVQDQLAKNSASQDIQNLKDSLQQRQQQQGGQAAQQAQKGGPPQQGEKQQGGQAQADADSASSAGDDSGDSANQSENATEGQQAQPGSNPQAAGAGKGQNPSGAPQAPMDIMGAPTKLNVKLEQEKLAGENDGGTPQKLEEASKQERSKLDYRNVRSDLTPAQKDVLNQDKIPWEKKSLIKSYFEAIRPAHPNP
jgi:hypothetical protein